MTKILAWHFVGATLRGGIAIPADGVKFIHKGPLKVCFSGLHASERLIDALRHAPGNTICRVECGGKVKRYPDKLVCVERTILWRVDGAELLRAFARQCALDVAHLWKIPDVVRRYLESGDEALRAEARNAAWTATRGAARDAAGATAWESSWAAAYVAARGAALAFADDAARIAARDIAPVAVKDAAREAAWEAGHVSAEWTQNTRLAQMVEDARENAVLDDAMADGENA